MEVRELLGYRLTVNSDPQGKITWSLAFDADDGKYSNTDTDLIFNVAHEFVTALNRLNPHGKVEMVKR